MADALDFKHGYLIACCNAMNLHGDSVLCRDTLAEAGITEDEVKAMDLSDYDAKALAEIRAEHRDPIIPSRAPTPSL
jgi:hypothetical protein